jgi:hypothetical protein
VNVIGTLTNSNEVNEILNVVKIFLVEERMKDLTVDISTKNYINDKKIEVFRKNNSLKNEFTKNIANFTVKGLN